MHFIRISLIPLVVSLLGTFLLNACSSPGSDNPSPTTGGSYTLQGSSPNGTASFVLQAPSLTSGSVSAVGNGADVTTFGTRPNNMMVKNGYYYNLNNTSKKFGKYQYTNNTLTAVTEIPFTDFEGVRSSNWIDDNTLLISGENSAETEIRYAIINVQTMAISSKGAFPLPKVPLANHILQAGTTFKRGNRFFIGYSYYNDNNVYEILDTAYVTVVDYPAMTNPVHLKDGRSAGAGGGNNLTWTIVDGSGDIYLMTAPSDFYGHSPRPTGVLRIKNGQEVFDPTYFFNLSAKLNNDDPLTITSVSGNTFMTKNGRQDLLKTYSDFTAGFIYEYYLGNLSTQTLTKIQTPLHKGLFNGVLVDADKAYFPVTSQNEGTFVYAYDPASSVTTKGLGVTGLDVVNWLAKVQ